MTSEFFVVLPNSDPLWSGAYLQPSLELLHLLNRPDFVEHCHTFFTALVDRFFASPCPDRFRKIFFIEGNIGAGKTTLMNALTTSNERVQGVDEPLKFWSTILTRTASGQTRTIFELFYNERDGPRAGTVTIMFQLVALYSRLMYLVRQVLEQRHAEFFVCERSIMTDRCTSVSQPR